MVSHDMILRARKPSFPCAPGRRPEWVLSSVIRADFFRLLVAQVFITAVRNSEKTAAPKQAH
jgi:hypothetical protein